MKIVAQSENWYLVQTGEQTGRVYDFGRNRLFAPMSLVALLARGGWESFVGDARPVLDAIGDAEEVGPAPAGQLDDPTITRRCRCWPTTRRAC